MLHILRQSWTRALLNLQQTALFRLYEADAEANRTLYIVTKKFYSDIEDTNSVTASHVKIISLWILLSTRLHYTYLTKASGPLPYHDTITFTTNHALLRLHALHAAVISSTAIYDSKSCIGDCQRIP